MVLRLKWRQYACSDPFAPRKVILLVPAGVKAANKLRAWLHKSGVLPRGEATVEKVGPFYAVIVHDKTEREEIAIRAVHKLWLGQQSWGEVTDRAHRKSYRGYHRKPGL